MEEVADHFEEQYRALVARILRPLQPQHGILEREIEVAEEKLGFRLPAVLRRFYHIAGRHSEINLAFDDLLSPEEIKVEDKHAFFYCEHQCGYAWAFALSDAGLDDPSVWSAIGPKPGIENINVPVSEFLISEFLTQATQAQTGHAGFGPELDTIPELPGWQRLELQDYSGAALVAEGRLFLLLSMNGDPPYQTAFRVRSKSMRRSLERELGLDIDWHE